MGRISKLLFIAMCAAAVALVFVPAAAFASPQAVIRDCAQDGKLDHHYSVSDLKKAEQQLPTDVSEYTNCSDVIRQALVAAAGSGGHGRTGGHGGLHGGFGGGAGGTGGGGRLGTGTPSAGDIHALADAQHGGAPSLTVGGQKVTPGTGGLFRTAGAANDLPLPALLALIAVAVVTATGGFVALRRRFPEVIGAAGRVFRR